LILKPRIDILKIVKAFILCLFILIFFSCQKDDFPGRATIGSKGGTVISFDGMVKMNIPPNSLSGFTEIRITESNDNTQRFFMGTSIGKVYKIEPSGTIFTNPVQVEISINNELINILDTENLGILNLGTVKGHVIYYIAGNKDNNQDRFINIISTNKNPNTGTISFSIDHLSQFQIVEFQNKCAIFNFYWNIPVIKWYMEPSVQSSYLKESIITNALDLWSNETSSFKFERTLEKKSANIIFSEAGNREGFKPFETEYHIHSEPVGMTCLDFWSTNTTSLSNEIVLDEEDQVTIMLASDLIKTADENANLNIAKKVLAHEIGHALGLGHTVSSTLPSPVMSETFDITGLWDGKLHQWDINALHTHYSIKQVTTDIMRMDTLVYDLEYPVALFLNTNKLYYTEAARYNTSTGGNSTLNVYDLVSNQKTLLKHYPENEDALIVIDEKVYLSSWKYSIPGQSGWISIFDLSKNEETHFMNLEIAAHAMCVDSYNNFYVLGSSDLMNAKSLYKFPASDYAKPVCLLNGLGRTLSIASDGENIYFSDYNTIADMI